MHRITMSIDDDLTSLLDRHISARGYSSRSEAMRDLVRGGLMRDGTIDSMATDCMATMSFVFDIETRDLPKRLTQAQNDNHDLSITTTYVALDHGLSLATWLLRGPIAVVRAFSDGLLTQKGISHGALNLIPVAPSHTHRHRRGDRTESTKHAHLKTIA